MLTEEEVASLQESLSERGGQVLCWKGSGLGGLDSEQRKKASPLLFLSPLFLRQQ